MVEEVDRTSVVRGTRCAVSSSGPILRIAEEADPNRLILVVVAVLVDHVARKGIGRGIATEQRRLTLRVGGVGKKDTGRVRARNQMRQGAVVLVEVAVGVALSATTPRISSRNASFQLVIVADKLAITLMLATIRPRLRRADLVGTIRWKITVGFVAKTRTCRSTALTSLRRPSR